VSPLAPKPQRSPTKAARDQVVHPSKDGRVHPQLSTLAQASSRALAAAPPQSREAANIFAGNRYVVSGIPEKLRCAFRVYYAVFTYPVLGTQLLLLQPSSLIFSMLYRGNVGLLLRDQLVKDITSRGGVVLTSVPADGNDSRDEVVSVVPQGPGGHGGDGQRKGCVIVISHPKEFRKPNYLLALATGEWYCGLCGIRHNTVARSFHMVCGR
jgi:hypothetical protein